MTRGGRDGTQWVGKQLTFRPRDMELIAWGAEYLGTSQADFIRTSVRVYAAILQGIGGIDPEKVRPPVE